ncbi:cytochrome P450 [Scleroderma yunnanense]
MFRRATEDAYGPCLFAGIFIAIGVGTFLNSTRPKAPKLNHIPTFGSPSVLLGSYWSAIKFSIDGFHVIQEGYRKHKTGVFKVATLTSWLVILNRNHLEDIIKSSEDCLSFAEAAKDTEQTQYILGPEIEHNPYHITIIRSQLTRNLPRLYPALRDEMMMTFDEILDMKDDSWKCVPAFETMRKVICRSSHRAFVGLPLCRDPGWNDLNLGSAVDIFREIMLLRLIPRSLIPIIAKYVTNVSQRTAKAAKYIGPIVAERLSRTHENGEEWSDKPDDFLQWCLDEGTETSASQLTQRILTLNMASIHTSTTIFVQALYQLAANLNYVQPLREEVEAIIDTDGWTKEAIMKMRCIDSFLKETQRFEGVSAVLTTRKAVRDVTLSDGTLIPEGTHVSIPTYAIHHDHSIYEHPETFDPFRYVHLQDKSGGGTRYQMVAVNPESLGFGLGKPACPGRFFAATLLKSMLAHVVVSYDVKLEQNASLPSSLRCGTTILANPYANVMFRRRID